MYAGKLTGEPVPHYICGMEEIVKQGYLYNLL